GHYLGLARVLNEQPVNCRKHAFGPNLNQHPEASHLLDAVAPLEMLSNSPNGSVEGYRLLPSGKIEAQRLIDEEENTVFHSYVSHFQQGVLFAAQAWASVAETVRRSTRRPTPCAYFTKHAVSAEPVGVQPARCTKLVRSARTARAYSVANDS
ncbi:MAG: hypothetical protein JNL62_30720, partial [Bryobacterales bacterium]|nr:hypothetical protein [Bryobacterales bacterium]